jgi:hypothetical protein
VRAGRLVDLVDGGKPARVAWKSLRKQVSADLEPPLRQGKRWAAIQELLDHAVDRKRSEEVDAYLLSARQLLKKLAKSTERPMARAGCRGIAAAISIRLGQPAAARKLVRQSIDILRHAITANMRALGAVSRHVVDDDLQYRRRYLGNEVMALRRYLGEELVVLDGSIPARPAAAARKATAHRPPIRRGRAKVPSWDEILFGVTNPDEGALRPHG